MDANKVTQDANRKLAERIGFMVMAEAQAAAEGSAMFQEIDRLQKLVDALTPKAETPAASEPEASA